MKRTFFISITLFLTISIFLACEKQDTDKLQEKENKKLIDYFKKNKIEPDTITNGIYYVHGRTGTGAEAVEGSIISVYYTGKLLDGKVFDSNVGTKKAFTFKLGSGYVIQGWDKGIVGMHEGDSGTLYVKSEKGYGSVQVGPIPPYSTLIFEIEIEKVKAKEN